MGDSVYEIQYQIPPEEITKYQEKLMNTNHTDNWYENFVSSLSEVEAIKLLWYISQNFDMNMLNDILKRQKQIYDLITEYNKDFPNIPFKLKET